MYISWKDKIADGMQVEGQESPGAMICNNAAYHLPETASVLWRLESII